MWGNGGNISLGSVMKGQFKPVADEAVSVLPNQVAKFSAPVAGKGTLVDHENLQVKST